MDRRLLPLAALLLALGLGISLPSLAYDAGDPVANFSATDSGGKSHSLSSYRGKVVVIVMWGSQCRTSPKYASVLKSLSSAHRGAVWLGVAPNAGESAAAIQKQKQAQGLGFPILVDSGGKIGKSFGAMVTPTVYVIDANGKLAYQGAISDRPRKPKKNYLDAALKALAAGRAPSPAKTRVVGFRIKY